MRILRFSWITVSMLFVAFGRPAAHELRHEVSQGDTVVVTFTYASYVAFSHEVYELFGPGDTNPTQSGRTDGNGQIKFVPDRVGSWRVRTFSPDGHGADITIEINGNTSLFHKKASSGRLVSKIVIGVAVIFVAFGGLFFFLRSKKL